MKLTPRVLFLNVSLAICGVFFTACNTTQQQTTFNALATIEATADTGYSNYVSMVIAGTLPTNQLGTISKVYNDLHASIALAANLDQAGTNVLVPTNITTELGSLLSLIQVATTNH